MTASRSAASPIDPAQATALDVSTNPRVAPVMDMVEKLSRVDDPQEVIRVFGEGFRQIRPVGAYLSLSTRGLAEGQYKITRFVADMKRLEEDLADPWADWHRLEVRTGGLLGQIIAGRRPMILHDMKVTEDPAVGDLLAPFGSLMAMPLFDDGDPINWAISLDASPRAFDLNELDESVLRANLVGGTVRNVLMTRRLREANSWIEREINQIASIQRALLPARNPQVPGLGIATFYQTYDRAGGDLYDFISAPSESDASASAPFGVLIADASGHGPSAAVVAAMVHAILHTYPPPVPGAAEVLEYANTHLNTKRIDPSFVTAFLGIFDPASRRLCYSRAGHPPPLLKPDPKSGTKSQRIDAAASFPLGVLERGGYEDAQIVLQPGQTVVLYTDGITEANGPDGEMFGIEGIERSLADCSGEPECVVESIVGDLRRHQSGAQPRDDQTIVALQVRE
ncbi:MAG: hypothetical protein CMJ18_03545 [Phycisphaeraceae bacterium]|nr:hypothetical protein [Phycisphaeraceae bacterium]